MKRFVPHILVRSIIMDSVIIGIYFVVSQLMLHIWSDVLFRNPTMRGLMIGVAVYFTPIGVILMVRRMRMDCRLRRAAREHDGAVCPRCLFRLTPAGRCNECGLEYPIEEARRLFKRFMKS